MGRLAFSTLGCPNWDFNTIVEQAKHLGYSSIEVRGIGSELRTDNLSIFTPEHRNATKRLLSENGLSICCVGTSVHFHEKSNFQTALDEGMSAIDVCRVMDIPAIRVFGDFLPPKEKESEIIARVADGIRKLCEYSEKSTVGKVQIWLETHGDFNTFESLLPLSELLHDCPLYGMIWDIEHTYRIGIDPIRFFREFKSLIRHTHFKDCYLEKGKPIAMLPGEGSLPIKEYYGLLESGGYTGIYSFEWEKRWIPELPDPEVAFPTFVDFINNT